MQVMALIYTDEAWWLGLGDAEREQVYTSYRAFADEAGAAGVLTGGDELGPTRDATTVRLREHETIVTDGPYAEAKEVLGGYFVLDVPTLEDAVPWAAKIPGAELGAVEVRAVHRDPEEAPL